jgi:hypothetical protein
MAVEMPPVLCGVAVAPLVLFEEFVVATNEIVQQTTPTTIASPSVSFEFE